MKIRIKGDTIRLRLSQSEVDEIGKGKTVTETTHFPKSTFKYSLALHDSDEPMSAQFDNAEICISVNRTIAKTWADSNQVGIISPSDAALNILIEKDFQCLTVRDGEDESDLFNNPNTIC